MSNLTQAAQEAQDNLGWSRMATDERGGTEFASATVDLARIVTRLARENAALAARIAVLERRVSPTLAEETT